MQALVKQPLLGECFFEWAVLPEHMALQEVLLKFQQDTGALGGIMDSMLCRLYDRLDAYAAAVSQAVDKLIADHASEAEMVQALATGLAAFKANIAAIGADQRIFQRKFKDYQVENVSAFFFSFSWPFFYLVSCSFFFNLALSILLMLSFVCVCVWVGWRLTEWHRGRSSRGLAHAAGSTHEARACETVPKACVSGGGKIPRLLQGEQNTHPLSKKKSRNFVSLLCGLCGGVSLHSPKFLDTFFSLHCSSYLVLSIAPHD